MMSIPLRTGVHSGLFHTTASPAHKKSPPTEGASIMLERLHAAEPDRPPQQYAGNP